MEREEFGVHVSHGELQFVNMENPLFKRLVEYLKKAPLDGLAIITNAYQRLEIDLDFSDTHSRTSRVRDAVHGRMRKP